MSSLALVATNGTINSGVESPHKYSSTQKDLIKEYQAALEVGRYFKLYNAASPYPRLISGDLHKEPLPLSFLQDDFIGYCRSRGKNPPNPVPSPTYLAYNLQTVTGTMFKPKGPALVQPKRSRHKYVNTFQQFEPQHPPLPLASVFLELLQCMFPDQVERDTFVQYCAHMFQHPEVRPSWHPMLLSETGTGKGFLFNAILSPLLCNQTMLVKRYSELTGRFANAMDGTILVQLDDCKSKREDVQTQLKSLMSEEKVLLEGKGLSAGMIATYTRFFLASNEDVPLDLDETERRWWIPKRLGYSNGLVGDEGRKQRTQAVIKPLAEWLELEGALESIHAYFMGYDLYGFDPKSPPMTETLREQISKSVTVEQTFAADFLSEHDTKVLKSEELCKAFLLAGMSKPGNRDIGRLLEYCGFRQDYLTVGTRSRWWFPISMGKAEAETILAARADF